MYFHSNGAVSLRMSQKKKHLLPRPHYAEWHGLCALAHPTPPPLPFPYMQHVSALIHLLLSS